MRFYRIPGSVAILLAFLSLPAEAADCGPLKLLNKIQLVSVDDRDLTVIPVSINGADKFMLFDTGGAATQITSFTVKELNLPFGTSQTGSMVDVNGNVSSHKVLVRDFKMGRLAGQDLDFPVDPDPNFGNSRLAGLIARDLLFGYDVDVDFGTKVLNLFSQDHCKGRVVYWNDPGVGVLPITTEEGHIHADVVLNGKTFDAVIDTGAEDSIISEPVALDRFGKSLDLMNDRPTLPINGKQGLIGRIHTFSSLAFGNVAVTNPRLVVLPDAMGDNKVRTHLPKMIIGMNILKHLHLYLAPKEERLYVSAASAAAPAAGAPSGP